MSTNRAYLSMTNYLQSIRIIYAVLRFLMCFFVLVTPRTLEYHQVQDVRRRSQGARWFGRSRCFSQG